MPAKMDDVVDALLTRWRALPALSGVTVYDGLPVAESAISQMITVGDDADPESDASNSFEQSWVDMACTRREETGEIVCAAVANSGSTDLSLQRIAAFTLLAACENDLRTDMTLGGTVFSAVLVSGRARSFQNAAGSATVVPFTVSYRANV